MITEYSKTDGMVRLAFRALSQTGCGAMVADNTGSIVFVNTRFCEITGYSEEELIGQNPRMLQSGATSRDTYLQLWNTISSGRTWHGQLQNRRKSGELFWESIHISPICNANGEITHYSAILDDVTREREEKQMDDELVEETCLEEKHDSLYTLTLGMAHDLNNMLTSILGACALAKEYAPDTELKYLLGTIESSATRGADFISQITKLWKPEHAPVAPLNLETVLLQVQAEEKVLPFFGVPCIYETAPVTIQGDPQFVKAAIELLLENAKDAKPRSPTRVRCGTLECLEPMPDEYFIPCGLSTPRVAYIDVEDTGEGMDPFALRRACNPFYSTRTGKKGLGLAKVCGIMRAHKGAVGLISEQGKGSRVRLYFGLPPMPERKKL